MGTLIQSQYPNLEQQGIWMTKALVDIPEFIQDLHLQYINSGADIITTYTYRTNPYALGLNKDSNIDEHTSEELVNIAVSLCKKAIKKASLESLPVLIAGSNATMSKSYFTSMGGVKDEEIRANHETHIENLIKAGVDFILNETFSHLKEIIIVCEICQSKKIPFVISIYCDENLKLLSQEPLIEAIEVIKKFNAMAISFNCISYSTMKRITEEIDLTKLIWGCYINCGNEKTYEAFKNTKEKVESMLLKDSLSPKELQNFTEELMNKKLRPGFIGSCCCSNPNHTQNLFELISKNNI